ncbi:hypothetical protein Ddc_11918 [Ditylenchus destructor]|nr:hypothetical protein Ddc_11918 [Ditylenchus destructor]
MKVNRLFTAITWTYFVFIEIISVIGPISKPAPQQPPPGFSKDAPAVLNKLQNTLGAKEGGTVKAQASLQNALTQFSVDADDRWFYLKDLTALLRAIVKGIKFPSQDHKWARMEFNKNCEQGRAQGITLECFYEQKLAALYDTYWKRCEQNTKLVEYWHTVDNNEFQTALNVYWAFGIADTIEVVGQAAIQEWDLENAEQIFKNDLKALGEIRPFLEAMREIKVVLDGEVQDGKKTPNLMDIDEEMDNKFNYPREEISFEGIFLRFFSKDFLKPTTTSEMFAHIAESEKLVNPDGLRKLKNDSPEEFWIFLSHLSCLITAFRKNVRIEEKEKIPVFPKLTKFKTSVFQPGAFMKKVKDKNSVAVAYINEVRKCKKDDTGQSASGKSKLQVEYMSCSFSNWLMLNHFHYAADSYAQENFGKLVERLNQKSQKKTFKLWNKRISVSRLRHSKFDMSDVWTLVNIQWAIGWLYPLTFLAQAVEVYYRELEKDKVNWAKVSKEKKDIGNRFLDTLEKLSVMGKDLLKMEALDKYKNLDLIRMPVKNFEPIYLTNVEYVYVKS